ncbi:MAG: RluA family pseudouridine synthase [Bacteroidota bacterium]
MKTKPIEPAVVYEDNHLIAVNKPFGMLSQGDETGDQSVFDWVKEYIRVTYNKPGNVYLGLLHRLDRPTGGVLLLAKTSKAASRMSKQFQSRAIQKVYVALTEKLPHPPVGTLKHYVKKLEGKNIMRAYNKEVPQSKPASLDYRLLRSANAKALIEVQPKTGRRHQIRVQLASIRCTIRGDVKYGNSQTSFNPDKSICLFAQKLIFNHPVTKEKITIEAPLPQSAWWKI